MAFLFLDDDAFPLATDDGPHSSAAMRQLLRNAAAIHAERFQKCGASYALRYEGLSSSCRLCSVWPVAWGPKWMYFHPSEPVATATVRLRIISVGLSDGAGAGSGDLMRVHVSTGDARGRISVPPPRPDDSRWTTPADGGELLASTAVESTLSLTVRVDGRNQGDPADPLAGWVAFYLWTWSVITTAAEDTGEVAEQEVLSGAVGVIWAGTGPVAAIDQPLGAERCLIIRSQAGNQIPGMQAGDMRQICHYRTYTLGSTTTADAALYLAPAPPQILASALFTGRPYVALHTMGVLTLAGLSVAADPPTFPVAEAGIYTDEPIRWQTHQTLSQELQRLVATRMPVWCIEPSYDLDVFDAGQSRVAPWRVFSQDLGIINEGVGGDNSLSTNSGAPTVLAVCPVANPPPAADLNGFRAIVTLAMLRARGSTLWGFHPRIKLRLAAYTWADVGVVAGSYTDWLYPAILNGFNPASGRWRPLAQNIWGAVGCYDWQLRGALIGTNTDSEEMDDSDWEHVTHHTVDMPKTDITYPALIKLEGYTDSATREIDLAVIGFGLASKSYADA